MLSCASGNTRADSTRKATTLAAATRAGSASRSRAEPAAHRGAEQRAERHLLRPQPERPPATAPLTGQPSAARPRQPPPDPSRRGRQGAAGEDPRPQRRNLPRPLPRPRTASTAPRRRPGCAPPAAPRKPRRPTAPPPPPRRTRSRSEPAAYDSALSGDPAPRSVATVLTYRPRRDSGRETSRRLQSRGYTNNAIMPLRHTRANTNARPTVGSDTRPATRQEAGLVYSAVRGGSRGDARKLAILSMAFR